VKKSQWITAGIGIVLVVAIYFLGRTAPSNTKKPVAVAPQQFEAAITIDTILHHAKEALTPAQITRLGILEKSVIRGDVKKQQLDVYHELAHFWKDSAKIFEPYAWYEAEAARLENSEKTLTFAAHLFLDDLRIEQNSRMKKWKAFQAKDLFERSLNINPKNDSSIIGLGAIYIFGETGEPPMIGIQKILQVAEKDSTNVFAQLMLGHGSVISTQYDKAIDRFDRVIQLQPFNLEAIMMLAEVYERKADNKKAIEWYTKALNHIQNPNLTNEVQKRIKELNK
jgi:tetratricopeptide (TPR) repeat protein